MPLGSPLLNRLFEHFEDIIDVYAADKARLQPLEIPPKHLEALLDKKTDNAVRILRDMQNLNGWVLTPDDAEYPDALRYIVGFPAVLYGQGEMPDLNTLPTIGVVSTRRITDAGAKTTFCLAAGLAAAGMVVVSGGAIGGDAAAHEGALSVNGKTVLVKAAAPDIEYPPQNTRLRADVLRMGGAIVTEFPPRDDRYCDYHIRNRLIAGMSHGVCVTEAPKRSGALITANIAREQGKDVFAMPGDTLDGAHDGTHQQIRNGATLITSAADILDEYAPRFAGMLDKAIGIQIESDYRRRAFAKTSNTPKTVHTVTKTTENITAASVITCPADASPEAQKLFALLEDTPCAVDDLAEKAGMSAQDVLIILTELELLGCAESTAGQQYRKCR